MTIINFFTIKLTVMQRKATDVREAEVYAAHRLTKEETANPWLVIEDLFDFGKLPEIRELLWQSFKTTITGDYPKRLSHSQRADVVCLYEYMERLVEAA